MILFAGFLAENKRKASTIRSYMSAIKAVLMDDGVEIHEDKFLLGAITKGCSIKNDKVITRLPIHRRILQLLLQKLDDIFDTQPFLRHLYKALFSTAYFGLFRVGELTKGDHPVKACDVHVGVNKKKMMLILRTSKTHWTSNKPQIIKICSHDKKSKKSETSASIVCREVNRQSFCPFQLLRKLH